MPETRSEMALPLKTGNKVIGAIDVQSKEPAAFDNDDVIILQTLADQLAIAIENARLFEATRRQIEELTILTYGRHRWRRSYQPGCINRARYAAHRRNSLPRSFRCTPGG